MILCNSVFAFILSESIGEAIDWEEAKTYKLFQNVKGFKEAKFARIDIGKYELFIALENDSLRIPFKAEPILALKDYLANFEKIENSMVERKAFEKRNSIVGYDIFGIPCTDAEIKEAMVNKERIGCILGGSTLGLFFGSLLGWSNAVEYVGYERHEDCLRYTSNIYQMNKPLFLAYSAGGAGMGSGIGYYAGSKWDFVSIKEQVKMRGFAYFVGDPIIKEDEVKKMLTHSNRNSCLLLGIPLSTLIGGVVAEVALLWGLYIQDIKWHDQIIGVELPLAVAVTIGIGTTITLINYFIRIGNDRDRKETINRIKEERAKLIRERRKED
ncbi:MAG: hypothetical protein ABIK67_01940 [candidate division WOR-3 bacterium]